MTVTCKFCHKSLRIEDISIKQYEARRTIDTCGVVVVEKKGNVVADKIHCGAMIVRGKVKAAVNCRGTVLVGAEAEIRGDVSATALAVGSGAILNGYYKIGQDETPPA